LRRAVRSSRFGHSWSDRRVRVLRPAQATATTTAQHFLTVSTIARPSIRSSGGPSRSSVRIGRCYAAGRLA
jgi:hypothetical protein